MCSDHFSPWSARQGHSGFAWSWLGAALATTSLPFGVVNAPGQRYHPAIIAQASATLAAMFPGRFWVALGTGEAVNEHITGDRWPPKPERQSPPARVRRRDPGPPRRRGGDPPRARCTSTGPASGRSPRTPPPLIGAAVSAETAGWAASWADGLITVNQPHRRAPARCSTPTATPAGADRPPSRSTCRTPPTTRPPCAVAHDQWRNGALGPPVCWDMDSVEALRRHDRATSARGPARGRAGVERPRRSTSPGSPSGPPSASTPCTSTTWARTSPSSSTSSAPRCVPELAHRGREDHRHQRRLVEDGGRLLPRRRDVPRLGRRRHRRPGRAGPAHRLPRRPRASPACG